MNNKMKALIAAGVAGTALVVGVGSYFMFRGKKTPAANDATVQAKPAASDAA